MTYFSNPSRWELNSPYILSRGFRSTFSSTERKHAKPINSVSSQSLIAAGPGVSGAPTRSWYLGWARRVERSAKVLSGISKREWHP